MPEPIESLKHEHRIIERALRALEGICKKIEGGEAVDAQTLFQFIEFIRGFADRCHHGKEEAHLFPELERHGFPREGGPIAVMLHEHDQGRLLIGQMAHAAEAYEREEPEAKEAFVEAARAYTELLLSHIEKEDNVLFRMAEQVLDDEAMGSLSEAFEKVEAELGIGVHQHYENLAAALEKTWTQ